MVPAYLAILIALIMFGWGAIAHKLSTAHDRKKLQRRADNLAATLADSRAENKRLRLRIARAMVELEDEHNPEDDPPTATMTVTTS